MNHQEEFLKYLNDNKSETTVSAYISDIKEYESWLIKKGFNLLSCTKKDIEAFVSDLKDMGRSGSTINRKLVSLRTYFEFLRDNKFISDNPVNKVKAPKVAQRELDYLSIEDIDKLLTSPDDSVKGIRDRALLELMYACGLKASELCDTNKTDVDLRIGFISVKAEGGKTRIIPIGRAARTAVINYLNSSREKLLKEKEDSGALFLNYAGERITRQGVWKIIKYYAGKIGLKEDVSPQILRNSFAAHMIQNGADLKSLQELLGHEDLAAIKLYMSLSKNRIMDVYDRTHPRA